MSKLIVCNKKCGVWTHCKHRPASQKPERTRQEQERHEARILREQTILQPRRDEFKAITELIRSGIRTFIEISDRLKMNRKQFGQRTNVMNDGGLKMYTSLYNRHISFYYFQDELDLGVVSGTKFEILAKQFENDIRPGIKVKYHKYHRSKRPTNLSKQLNPHVDSEFKMMLDEVFS